MDSINKVLLSMTTIAICAVSLWLGGCDGTHARIGNYSLDGYQTCGNGALQHMMPIENCFLWHNVGDVYNKIMNGRDAYDLEMNYVVPIQAYWHREGDETSKWNATWFTGVLLTPTWVLTNGDIVRKFMDNCPKTPVEYKCALFLWPEIDDRSTADPMDNPHNVPVNKPEIHYLQTVNDQLHRGHDLALLQLSREIPMSLNGKEMNSICLPVKGIYNKELEFALMAGWGFTNNTVKVPPRKTQVGVVSIVGANTDATLLHTTIQGVVTPPDTGAVICAGDEGSPLIQYSHGRAVLIGIQTMGIYENKKAYKQCLNPSVLSVPTWVRVSSNIDWILKTMKYHH